MPADADQKDFNLNCDWLEGVCTVYFNGTELKEANAPAVKFSKAQHAYVVPKALIQAGSRT